jgi:hypothetical protein
MDCNVAEGHDVAPLDIRVPLLKLRTQPRGRLTNDGQLLKDRTAGHLVPDKRLPLQAGDEFGYGFSGLHNVGQI